MFSITKPPALYYKLFYFLFWFVLETVQLQLLQLNTLNSYDLGRLVRTVQGWSIESSSKMIYLKYALILFHIVEPLQFAFYLIKLDQY